MKTITPAEAAALVAEGARIVDVREADEFARRHIAGAVNAPLSRLDRVEAGAAPAVIFHCRSGARTAAHGARLADAATCPAYVLEGGIDAWAAAGLPVETEPLAPLELMRQVQLAAGGLVLIGVLLGFTVAPAWFGLAAFVGAGLTMAGATGWCGMARLLAHMPWNRALAR